MRVESTEQNGQRYNRYTGARRSLTLWWLDPRVAILFLGILLLIGAYLVPRDTYLTLYRSEKHVDLYVVAVGLIVYLAFIVGSSLLKSGGRRSQEGDVLAYCRTFVWPLFALTIFGYATWFSSAVVTAGGLESLANALRTVLFQPETGESEYVKRVLFQTLPGITTFTQFGILYATVEALLWVRRASYRNIALVRMTTVAAFAIPRAILLSERGALYEIVVPVAVVLLDAMWTRRSYRNFARLAPIYLGLGVFALFAFAEYFRSWIFYKAIYAGNYLHFVVDRFLGYYFTSVNNAAVLYYFEPVQPLRYTLTDLLTFPLLGPVVKRWYTAIFGDTYINLSILLDTYANYEFNTVATFGLLINEYSVYFAPVIGFFLGLISSTLHRGFAAGRLVGTLLYPSWFVGLLEISRYYTWTNQRYFPTLAFLAISLVLYRYTRSPKKKLPRAGLPWGGAGVGDVSSRSLARWGATAVCLGGISYGTWGYLDDPHASGFVVGTVLPVLEVTTPTLFLGGFIGLYSWLGRGGGLLQRTGLVVGLLGTMLGVINGLTWGESEWWTLLFAGLTAVGVGTVVQDASRLLGVLVLASGTLGLVSLLTDPAFSGVLVPMRAVHVAFVALFCLSCVVWGWVLFREASGS
jgi:hypothetical protein